MEISDHLVAIVGILSIFVVPFAAIAWVLITLINSRNKTQHEMIRQGLVPNFRKPAPNKYITLRNGCLFIGLACGLLVGFLVQDFSSFTSTESLLVISSSITFFLGLGYLVFYVLVRDKNLDDE